MWNGSQKIQLTTRDLREAQRIAIAPIEDEISRVNGTLSELALLTDSAERALLIERALALREEWQAIKAARLAVRARQNGFRVGYDKLINGFCRNVDLWIRKLVSIHDNLFNGHRVADERRRQLRRAVCRGHLLVARLRARLAVSARFCPAHTSFFRASIVSISRSTAARRRRLAPMTAPPLPY